MSMLKVENLSVHYGMIQAVRDVSFEVNEGEVVSLIGANGGIRTFSSTRRPSCLFRFDCYGKSRNGSLS